MGGLGDLYEKYVEDPISGAAHSILPDEVYSYLAVDWLSDVDPGNILDPFKDAAKESEKLALSAAETELLSTAESVRIMEEENERSVSTARARAGASGLSGASTEMYIASLEETGQQDVEWLKTVGASNYEARVTEGRLAQAQSESSMWQLGASAVGVTTGVLGLFG